jgi:hypothetical protein
VEITSLTRHILEIMVSKFSNIMININKVIDNRSTFFSGGVTSCTRNVKYFCHLSVSRNDFTIIFWKNMVLVDYIGIFFTCGKTFGHIL